MDTRKSSIAIPIIAPGLRQRVSKRRPSTDRAATDAASVAELNRSPKPRPRSRIKPRGRSSRAQTGNRASITDSRSPTRFRFRETRQSKRISTRPPMPVT